MLDVGCNFYKAWYYAKTDTVTTSLGICDQPSGCVYGQQVASGYTQNIPLQLQPWNNLVDWTGAPVGASVYQLDPGYVDGFGAPIQNQTMWGWDTYTAAFAGLTSVACSGPLTCTAVGAAQTFSGQAGRTNYDGYSTILTTFDGGFSWQQYDFKAAATAAQKNFTAGVAPTADLNKVFFANNKVGWAVGGDWLGNNGIILETTDAGVTWHTTTPNPIQLNQMYQYEAIPYPPWATAVVNTAPLIPPGGALKDTQRGFWPGADPTTTTAPGYSTAGKSVYIPAELCDGTTRNNGISYGAWRGLPRDGPTSQASSCVAALRSLAFLFFLPD